MLIFIPVSKLVVFYRIQPQSLITARLCLRPANECHDAELRNRLNATLNLTVFAADSRPDKPKGCERDCFLLKPTNIWAVFHSVPPVFKRTELNSRISWGRAGCGLSIGGAVCQPGVRFFNGLLTKEVSFFKKEFGRVFSSVRREKKRVSDFSGPKLAHSPAHGIGLGQGRECSPASWAQF